MFSRSAQAAMEGERLQGLLTGDNAAARLVSMLTS